MKKPLRLFSLLLAVCIAAASFPQTGFAGAGNIHNVSGGEDISKLFAENTVEDGDTIQITGSAVVKAPGATGSAPSDDRPWVIDKNVTITGGTLIVWVGGIVLDADVTFQNISLSFSSNVRNAIVANGHTLTLENVTCENSSFNLFCGGLINSNNENFAVPAPGGTGTIRINGKTSLQNKDTYGSGNIYAGNLCMGGMNASTNGPDNNGPANTFSGDSVIIIEDCQDVGSVYACGAQQRIPVGQESGKVTLPNATDYTVSGSVTVSGKVPNVSGAGSQATNVVYRGDGNLASRVFSDISSLSVESGNLELTNGSSFRDGNTVSVASGAKLNLKNLAGSTLEIGDFNGGGFLILAKQQTLPITGTVTGTTAVAIGDVNYDNTQSSVIPEAGRTYIQAPDSQDGAFQLLPYATQPDMTLVRDNNGNWTASNGSSDGDKIKDFSFDDTEISVETGGSAEFPLTVEASAQVYLDFIPLNIYVNDKPCRRTSYEQDGDTYYTYTSSFGEFTMEVSANSLSVNVDSLCSPGAYTIRISIPKEYTASGTALFKDAVLNVTGSTTPGQPISIPVPQAKTGLTWTGAEQTGVDEGAGYTLTGHKASDAGSYTAAAVLLDGYQWTDGTRENKAVSWSIAKSMTPPAAPGGLAGIAPTSADGADGKITGTSVEMEYSGSGDFSAPKNCGAGETAGLVSGTYYVRVKDTPNHTAGAAAQVTVPAYGTPYVTEISIETPADKLKYQVGDALDVSGLTIRAVYSDGASQTVPVTADMVSGFDSGRAAESQVLTIRYAGQTVSYEIQIAEPAPPQPGHRHSWSTDWTTDKEHHWHSCTAAGCPTQEDSQKNGYAAHTAGDWVVDRPAGTSHSGSRYKACTVCGYEMVRETIPAIGGGNSGGSSGGSSSGGNSSGGSSSGSTTGKNPGGAATTTDKTTGTVTEVTKNPDGSTVTVETRKDGVVITTEEAADGSTVKTTANPDGSSQITVRRSDGTTASVSTDVKGATTAQVSLSGEAVSAARRGNGAVSLPIPAVSASSKVDITLPGGSGAVRLEIPVKDTAPGVVAVIVGPDGSETVVKKSSITGNGVALTLDSSAAVKIVDNSTVFSDVSAGSWEKNAVDFVSARGIFSGTGGRAFSPDGTMTRGMLAVALHNLEGSPARGHGSYFTDVGETWYTDAVQWAADQGIISGYDNGRYGPNDNITREQLAVMLWRYAGSPAAADKELRFADADRAGAYAREALCWAMESGIINGDGNGLLDPRGTATRAQTAQMMMNFIQAQL